jgi:2-succinyl-5-enolpyruvyl-6-hydroxy-3-cyclohexene-1-carboxylate synthase
MSGWKSNKKSLTLRESSALPSMTAHNNLRWAELLIEECVRLGVDTFYAAPGSRSTPLVMAVARHPDTRMIMHVDERATAFLALGYGRAAGRPAAWITTSGTALANGFPAIVEASMEAVPMLLLTADRPPELRDTDANQTIRQDHMFGRYVRWFVDVPTPSDEVPFTWLLSTVDEAVHRASDGPVHLNCMFRKPLVPLAAEAPTRPAWWESEMRREEGDGWRRWLTSGEPFTHHVQNRLMSAEAAQELAVRIRSASRPIFVFGRLRGNASHLVEQGSRLADRFGTVGLVDIGSQMRTGIASDSLIPALDAVLYGDGRDELAPDLIVQFGATPVSMRQTTWAPGAERIVVDSRPRRIDPATRGGTRIHADPLGAMERLSATELNTDSGLDASWKPRWSTIHMAVSSWMVEDLGSSVTEQRVARIFSECVPQDACVSVASSNPARHADLFFATQGARVPVSLNRGASGIDGTLATACGFADASATRPFILIGDLALQHDMTSLALCADRAAVVVVINNDGGGIFSYLPIRDHEEVFEPWFGTPHGKHFEHAAAHFDLRYVSPDTESDVRRVMAEAVAGRQGILIEIKTDRQANLNEQRRLLRVLSTRIDHALGTGGKA